MDLIKIVSDFIENDDSDGAIMINGLWGIGKSYFWRVKVVPHLENLKNANTEKKYKCLYISLNGIKQPEEIFNQLVMNKLPWTKTKVAKMTYSIGGFMLGIASKIPFVNNITGEQGRDAFKNFKIEDFLNFENNIICFDDLERLGKGNSTEEMLGFINTNFIETNRVKIIIIANEKEIKNKDEYLRIKEKTISRTINFDKNLISIDEIFNRYKKSERYKKFLDEHKSYIKELIDDFSQNNLRTLIFCLDILKKVFETSHNLKKDGLANSLILFIFIISFDFKDGKLTSNDYNNFKNLDKLSEEEYKSILISRLIAKNQLVHGKTDKKETEKETYEFEFYTRFKLDSKIEYQFFVSIYNYILSGYLNEGLLKTEISNFKEKKIVTEQISLQKQVFQNLMHVYWLDNDEVIENSKIQLLEFAKKGDYAFYEYGTIFSILKQLKQIDLIEDDLTDLKNTIIEGLNCSIQRQNFDANALHFIELNRLKDNDTDIDNLIDNEIKKQEKKKNQKVIDDFFQQLQGDYRNISETNRYYNPFESLSGDEIFQRIKDFTIPHFRNLISIFDGISKIQNVKDFYSKNSSEIPVLVQHLEEFKKRSDSRLKKHILKTLIVELTKLSERLK